MFLFKDINIYMCVFVDVYDDFYNVYELQKYICCNSLLDWIFN